MFLATQKWIRDDSDALMHYRNHNSTNYSSPQSKFISNFTKFDQPQKFSSLVFFDEEKNQKFLLTLELDIELESRLTLGDLCIVSNAILMFSLNFT